MIDCPANTDDYNIPQIQPKPVEPTQSVVEIPYPIRAAPATPPPSPPLKAIKKEAELEAEKQLQESQQDGIDRVPVTENLATEISNNKHCVNNCPEIEISECDNTNCINPENNRCNILEKNSSPKPHSNPQVNSNYSGTEEGKEEALEKTQSDDKHQNSHNFLPFPADGAQQSSSQCIIIEAKTHDY